MTPKNCIFPPVVNIYTFALLSVTLSTEVFFSFLFFFFLEFYFVVSKPFERTFALFD